VTVATVSVEWLAAGPVVHAHGEIDLSNADAVRTELLASNPRDGPGMIVDLTHTTYLDSIGLRLLFEVAEPLRTRGRHLVVVVTNEGMIRRVAALTKFDTLVALVTTIDEAVSALRASGGANAPVVIAVVHRGWRAPVPFG